ncbi:MAG: hypothetical protein P1U64_08210 [Alcanivoracaceae bacterium]|nr:hypothetical protein [Alcanivoracaceae bacterium]
MRPIFFALLFFLVASDAHAASIEGKWRSNKELTSGFNNRNAILEERQRIFFDQLMGHMTIEFLDGVSKLNMPSIEVHSDGEKSTFEGFTEESTYTILGQDKDTVVVKTQDLDGSDLIVTYHFEGQDIMWVYVAGHSSMFSNLNIREYFVRCR